MKCLVPFTKNAASGAGFRCRAAAFVPAAAGFPPSLAVLAGVGVDAPAAAAGLRGCGDAPATAVAPLPIFTAVFAGVDAAAAAADIDATALARVCGPGDATSTAAADPSFFWAAFLDGVIALADAAALSPAAFAAGFLTTGALALLSTPFLLPGLFCCWEEAGLGSEWGLRCAKEASDP